MRNRFLTGMLMLSALFLSLTSCQKQENFPQGGTPTDVTISVAVPQGAALKSNTDPGNGDQINRCILEIYDATNTLVGTRQEVAVTGNTATFKADLISNTEYTFVFWADCANEALGVFSDNHYSTTDLSAVTMLGDFGNNDDTRDAFFCTEKKTVDGTDLAFQLKRPFGQVNIFTTDFAVTNLNAADITVSVDYSTVPTTLNLLTGETGTADGSLTAAAAIASVDIATTGQLTFDYIFAPSANQTLVGFSLEVLNNGVSHVTYDATNIPVQRNHRTNVRSSFLTEPTNISIQIVPGTDGEHSSNPKGEQITTGVTLLSTASAPTANSNTITYTVDVDAAVTVTSTGVAYREAGTADTYTDVAGQAVTRAAAEYEATLTGLAAEKNYEYVCFFVVNDVRYESNAQEFTTPAAESTGDQGGDVTLPDPQVGDYYYSDGTWSTTLDASKTPIAIVYWVGNPATDDTELAKDHPKATHGLAVALHNTEKSVWTARPSSGNFLVYDYVTTNASVSYPHNFSLNYTLTLEDVNKMLGYANTKIFGIWANAVTDIENCYTQLEAYRNTYTAPEASSGWYIPCAWEFKQLLDNYNENPFAASTVSPYVANIATQINTVLATVNGDAIALSTKNDDGSYNFYHLSHEYNTVQYSMMNAYSPKPNLVGTAWNMQSKTQPGWVRPILAF